MGDGGDIMKKRLLILGFLMLVLMCGACKDNGRDGDPLPLLDIGTEGHVCMDAFKCNEGLYCDLNDNICKLHVELPLACGDKGLPCCDNRICDKGPQLQCSPDNICKEIAPVPRTDVQCGTNGIACCADNTCSTDDLVCKDGVCNDVVYRLQVSIKGEGKVSSDPAGIDCTSKCSAEFKKGSTVTLTATESGTEWKFKYWMLDGRPVWKETLQVSMDKELVDILPTFVNIQCTADNQCGLGEKCSNNLCVAGQRWERVGKMDFPPQATNIVETSEATIISTKGGGVFKTSDKGDNWIELNNGLHGRNVYDLINIGGKLYAATGDGIFVMSGGKWTGPSLKISCSSIAWNNAKKVIYVATWWKGVYKSTNNGQTWDETSLDLPDDTSVDKILLAGDLLFAMAGGVVYKTADDGDTWEKINTGIEDGISAIAYDGKKIFAGTQDGFLFISTDYNTWVKIEFLKQLGMIRDISLIGDNLFVSDAAETYKSMDDGASWSKSGPGAEKLLYWNGAFYFVANWRNTLKSIDEGQSWTNANNNFPEGSIKDIILSGSSIYVAAYDVFKNEIGNADLQRTAESVHYASDLMLFGDTLLVGTTNGIFQSTSNEQDWTETGLNKNVMRITSMGDTLYAGTWDDGIHESTDDGVNWSYVGGKETLKSLVKFISANNVLFAVTYPNKIFKSTDNALTWVQIDVELDGLNAVRDLIAVGNDLYVIAGCYVHKSTDNAESWERLDNSYLSNGCSLRSLYYDGQAIYMGTYEKVYKSTDGGSTWQKIGGDIYDVWNFLTISNYIFAGTNYGLFVYVQEKTRLKSKLVE
jgi:photosystem II stability/assembly factor-like uncharacterized protein